jgi:hypothetical protein
LHQADVPRPGRGKKLRIAVAIRDDPASFERDESLGAGWDIPGVGVFERNPRSRVTDDHWALLRLRSQCDRGMAGLVYPDGKSVLDQPLLLLDAFAVIGAAEADLRKAKD